MPISRKRLKKRPQQQFLKKVENKADKRINALFSFLLIAGVVLLIFEVEIYRDTLIPALIPGGILLVVGISSFFLLRRYMARHNVGQFIFSRVFVCLVGFGGIAAYGFMALNCYAPVDDPTEVVDVGITGTGRQTQARGRCASPYAIAVVKGYEKQFICVCDARLNEYDGVRVQLKRGLFGFDNITSWWLLRKE